MLSDLIINAVLLVAVTFVYGHVSKEIPEKKLKTVYGKIALGIFGGLTGILLLVYTIEVNGTLIDIRVYALMMVSHIGGIIPTLLTGIIIGLFRIEYFGASISSTIAWLQIILFIISFSAIEKIVKGEAKRWFSKVAVNLAIILGTYYYLLKGLENVQVILINLVLVNLCAGVLEYFLLGYVKSSNELYRIYKKGSAKDYLTGLYNIRQFDKMLNEALERAEKKRETLSCLIINIDHFKKINDLYGHAIGDLVLKELAAVITKNSGENCTIGRIGGEEFCVLLHNYSIAQIYETALRINKAVQMHSFPIGENHFVNITVSVGLSIYPHTTTDLDTLKEFAARGLYLAKQNGRNRVCDYQTCVEGE